jgi:hypothetical protein
VLGLKRAKTAQFYALSFGNGLHHEGDKAIHNGLGLYLRQARTVGNLVDDFGFGHGFWGIG